MTRRFPLVLVALVLALTLALSACGNGSGAGDGTSGISGTVTIGPTCPVERADSPCPPTPYAANITIEDGGDVVATGRSGEHGAYRIAVPPGEYTVTAEPVVPNPIAQAQPVEHVKVVSGAFATVDISFDSGIR